MPIAARRALFFPLLVLVALGIAACGSSSKTTATTATTATSATNTGATTATTASSAVLVGKQTSVALNPATSQLLRENQIVVTAVAPATYHNTLLVPVSGGHVAVATVAGTIEHTGGIRLSHAGNSVQVTSFLVDTSTDQVTALVAGQRIPIFAINKSSAKHQTGTGGTILESGLTLALTEQAADALNTALGTSPFKPGQVFGTATLTLAVKA
jgi:hypothetical protein